MLQFYNKNIILLLERSQNVAHTVRLDHNWQSKIEL